MVTSETQHEIAAQRSESVAAHRRMTARRFGAEEHEANAHLPCRLPAGNALADARLPAAFELALG